MPNYSNRIFCRLDGLTPAVREQQRVNTLQKLGLLDTESVPVFDEATQTAARLLETPICILGLMVQQQLFLKSAVGLSRLGLMNDLAASRKLPRSESYCTYVVDSQQTIVIEDCFVSPVFAASILAQHYGIRSYLGTPLITNDGWCIGTLAVMDSVPRQFTHKDVECFSLIARWCLREFERDYLLKHQSYKSEPSLILPSSAAPNPGFDEVNNSHYSLGDIKLKILEGLTEKLRRPLTSIIGMSSILRGEVFGALTQKQKEYVNIIHNSGQEMNHLVDEILKLGTTFDKNVQEAITPVNLAIICHQIIKDLSNVAQQKDIELHLTIEPGSSIWLMNKEKVHQCIYYLLTCLIKSAEPKAEIRIHFSHRHNELNLTLWINYLCQRDNLSSLPVPVLALSADYLPASISNHWHLEENGKSSLGVEILNTTVLETNLEKFDGLPSQDNNTYQILLGLLLACYLVEELNGKIEVQGSPESAYRYILTLPKITAPVEE